MTNHNFENEFPRFYENGSNETVRVRSRENLSRVTSAKKKNVVVFDHMGPRHRSRRKSQKEIVARDQGRPANKKK